MKGTERQIRYAEKLAQDSEFETLENAQAHFDCDDAVRMISILKSGATLAMKQQQEADAQDAHYVPVRKEFAIIDLMHEDALDKAIAKLNQKAIKIDCDTVRIEKTLIQETERKYDRIENRWHERQIDRLKVSVIGEVVKIAGYRLIAKVASEGGEIRIVDTVPGETAPKWARNADMARCDHCNMKRYRNDVFLLQNDETEEIVQVGRSCLKDFYGGHDANRIIALFEWLGKVAELGTQNDEILEFGGFSSYDGYEVTKVLQTAAAVIRENGFVSRKEADMNPSKCSTVEVVKHYLTSKNESADVTDFDVSTALKTVEYFQNLTERERESDYMNNLFQLMRMDSIPYRRIALLTSAISAYQRHVEREAEKQAAKSYKSSHVGAVGDRIKDVEAAILSVRFLNTYYGVSTLIMMKDTNDNVYKWFASGVKEYEERKQITLSGTVKKHDEYNGVKNTILSRCSIKYR